MPSSLFPTYCPQEPHEQRLNAELPRTSYGDPAAPGQSPARVVVGPRKPRVTTEAVLNKHPPESLTTFGSEWSFCTSREGWQQLEVGTPPLLASQPARVHRAAPGADASPATPCQRQPLGMRVGKTPHTHTPSRRLQRQLSQLSPSLLQRRYAESDGAYHVGMGREWLLGFKEQIRPSK